MTDNKLDPLDERINRMMQIVDLFSNRLNRFESTIEAVSTPSVNVGTTSYCEKEDVAETEQWERDMQEQYKDVEAPTNWVDSQILHIQQFLDDINQRLVNIEISTGKNIGLQADIDKLNILYDARIDDINERLQKMENDGGLFHQISTMMARCRMLELANKTQDLQIRTLEDKLKDLEKDVYPLKHWTGGAL